MKHSRAKPAAAGAKRVEIAIPMFGCKNHVGIDRRHGLIRTSTATDAARHDGAQLPALLDTTTPRAGSGRTPRIARRRTRSISRPTASPAASTARSRRASRCRSTSPAPTPQSPSCAPRRACLRPPEGADGAGHPHHRSRKGAREDRARQPRLQHAPHGLARRSRARRPSGSISDATRKRPKTPAGASDFRDKRFR
jgi:hypothetical protein